MAIFAEVLDVVIVGGCVRSCDCVVSGVGLELVDLPGFEGGAWSTCEALDVAADGGTRAVLCPGPEIIGSVGDEVAYGASYAEG